MPLGRLLMPEAPLIPPPVPVTRLCCVLGGLNGELNALCGFRGLRVLMAVRRELDGVANDRIKGGCDVSAVRPRSAFFEYMLDAAWA